MRQENKTHANWVYTTTRKDSCGSGGQKVANSVKNQEKLQD